MMRTASLLLIHLLAALLCCSAEAGSQVLTPAHLNVDLQTDPLGVASQDLTFSWILHSARPPARDLRQTGYRIRIARSLAQLARPKNATWDSGRVASSTYWQIPYTGAALEPATTYYWKAQVQTEVQHGEGNIAFGKWSHPARFTTSLDKNSWSARWIAATPDGQDDGPVLPVFRHEFNLKAPVESALLFVSGLGQYEVHLNGRNVTQTVLNPGWSDYRKTVFYDTYSVAPLLHPGPNAFGVLLGNGMYNVQRTAGRYSKFTGSFGQPKCLLQLMVRYTDGSSQQFNTDSSWQSHPGPITFRRPTAVRISMQPLCQQGGIPPVSTPPIGSRRLK
jgi:alpha-L-rhamnosidase